MNTVTFETAKALQDAGFSQPFPAFGQQWYFPETKELFLVTFVYSNGTVDYCMEGSNVVMLEDMPEGSIFAPTATDILAQLPGDDIGYYPTMSDGWVSFSDYGETTNEHKNPHELAAKLFLLNKAVKE